MVQGSREVSAGHGATPELFQVSSVEGSLPSRRVVIALRGGVPLRLVGHGGEPLDRFHIAWPLQKDLLERHPSGFYFLRKVLRVAHLVAGAAHEEEKLGVTESICKLRSPGLERLLVPLCRIERAPEAPPGAVVRRVMLQRFLVGEDRVFEASNLLQGISLEEKEPRALAGLQCRLNGNPFLLARGRVLLDLQPERREDLLDLRERSLGI